MPLTRISMRKGHSPAFMNTLMDVIYRAMRTTFDVPEGDRFMLIDEYDQPQFSYGADYLNIERTDDLIIIEITANRTRTVAQKKALYAAIATSCVEELAVRSEDIFISLTEGDKENWSFRKGEAQYA